MSYRSGQKANQLLVSFVKLKHPLPPYVRSYWLARLAVAAGNKAEAKAQFEVAYKLCGRSALYQRRIKDQIKALEDDAGGVVEPDALLARQSISVSHMHSLENVWTKFEKTTRALEIVEPVLNSRTVSTLVIFTLAAFIVSYIYAILPNHTTETISAYCFGFGLLNPTGVRSGEYWRLLTSLFLHLHFFHLFFNLIGLWWFGRIAQNIYGTVPFLIIYFVSGIASGAGYVLLGAAVPALGASGAIMGVIGAVAVGIFRLRDELPGSIRKKQLMLMVGLLVLQAIMDRIIPNIGVSIHTIGIIIGALLGCILPLPIRRNVGDSRSQDN